MDLNLGKIKEVVCHKCGQAVDVSDWEPFTVVACPSCSTRLPVPALIGKFVLLKRLGHGSFGDVFMGFDRSLNRHVAIKVLHRDLGESEAVVERFRREARAIASLNHAHVVQVHAFDQYEGQPYIVMELVEGDRLDKIMEREGALQEVRALRIAIDVVKGLRAASQVGLVHGDVKPGNILIDKDGHAKVVDFGLAHLAKKTLDPERAWGSPLYLAPETVRRQEEDHRADIYSLGATLYHALVGQPPFVGDDADEVARARLHRNPVPIDQAQPSLRKKTCNLVTRMLQVSPAGRHPTYASLLADLQDGLRVAKGGDSMLSKSPFLAHLEERKKGVPVWGVVLLVVVAVAVTAGMIFAVRALTKSPEPQPVKQVAGTERVVKRFVGGRLVDVPVTAKKPAAAPAPARPARTSSAPAVEPPPVTPETALPEAAPPVRKVRRPKELITVVQGLGADTYVRGDGDGEDHANTNFGPAEELRVRADADLPPGDGCKIYLRFDLSIFLDLVVEEAQVNMVLAQASSNATEQIYKLRLWGLSNDQAGFWWEEGNGDSDGVPSGELTWNSAPANERADPGAMGEGAELLAEAEVPAVSKPGHIVSFTDAHAASGPTLTDFVNRDHDKMLCFVVTAAPSSGQTTGWFIASKEQDKHPPPTLAMSRKGERAF